MHETALPNPAPRRARRWHRPALAGGALLGAAALLAASAGAAAAATPSMVGGQGGTMAGPGSLAQLRAHFVASVVAPNGDANPYSLAIVPITAGHLTAGNVLVTDFNNGAGLAGAGTSIMQVDPATGSSSLFFQGSAANGIVGPVGIALNPAKDIVWLGDYGPANAAGVYDGSNGSVALVSPAGAAVPGALFDNTTTDMPIFNGVWGQAVSDVNGSVSFYWTNAGNGTTGQGGGGIWRLDPLAGNTGQPLGSTYTLLAKGLPASPAGSTAATAAGPQGMVFDPANDTLYVSDDATNEIVAIPAANSATGPATPIVVRAGGPLHAPQQLAIDPSNGNLLVVNGAVNNDLVELTTSGRVVGVKNIAPESPAGSLFGLAATTVNGQTVIYFDNSATGSLEALAPAAGMH